MNTCVVCAAEKPVADFYKDGGRVRRECRACTLIRVKKYREENRDKHNARSRAWHHRKRATVLARKKRYYQSNKDAHLKRAAAWATANPHKAKLSRDKWNNKNRERLRANDQKWAKANRDKKRVHEFNRRARELGAGGTATSEQVKARVAFYGGLCWICQDPYRDVDHVIPLAKGGTNFPANLRCICKSCNSSKGAKHPSQVPRSTTITPCPLPG
jgi:5-methylcytosine-specific restriction endonuclease McrA